MSEQKNQEKKNELNQCELFKYQGRFVQEINQMIKLVAEIKSDSYYLIRYSGFEEVLVYRITLSWEPWMTNTRLFDNPNRECSIVMEHNHLDEPREMILRVPKVYVHDNSKPYDEFKVYTHKTETNEYLHEYKLDITVEKYPIGDMEKSIFHHMLKNGDLSGVYSKIKFQGVYRWNVLTSSEFRKQYIKKYEFTDNFGKFLGFEHKEVGNANTLFFSLNQEQNMLTFKLIFLPVLINVDFCNVKKMDKY